ncbi:MAG: hypothetical protein K6G88_15835 [Lachnospiraceae bacterium]|nr:hypothetical protein [Lachnospiraceae bacterium]
MKKTQKNTPPISLLKKISIYCLTSSIIISSLNYTSADAHIKESVFESQSESVSESQSESQSESVSESQSESQSESVSESQSESQSESVSESQSQQPTTPVETTTALPIMERLNGTPINKLVYLKKTSMAYDANLKPVRKIKKRIQYYHLKQFSNGYSMIKYDNEILYINTNLLTYISNLKPYVNPKDKKYTYKDMVSDITNLSKVYPNIFHSNIIGKTPDNRDIYSIILGNPAAEKTIFIECSIHAREYTNTHVLMKIFEETCINYDTAKYKEKNISDIYNNTKLVIIPMANPDGVSISQLGAKAIRNKKLRKKIIKIGKGHYSQWKANARCVDLNRNFAEGFGYKSAKRPSSEEYAGKKALSEPEVVAEVNMVKRYNPNAVIFVHQAGQVIYYRYKSKLLSMVKRHTNYTLIRERGRRRYGTASDFVDKLGITNCTIENGIVPAPLSHKQFDKIYQINKDLFTKAAILYMN